METNYRLKKTNNDNSTNDCELNLPLNAFLPVLTLKSSFLDRLSISENTYSSGNSDNTIYNATTGDELTTLAVITTPITKNENILVIDSDKVLLVPGLNDIDAEQFTDRDITLQSYGVGGRSLHYSSGESIAIPKDGLLSKFNFNSTNLTGSKIYSLNLKGVHVGDENTYLREPTNGSDSSYVAMSGRVLTVLEIDVASTGLDLSQLALYTIYTDAFSHQRLRFVGTDTSVDKVYIPLF